MKWPFTFLFVFVLIGYVLAQTKNRDLAPLSWDLFKGQPPSDTPYVALVSARFGGGVFFDSTSKTWVTIIAVALDRGNCWVKTDALNRMSWTAIDMLAEHEKYHFYLNVLAGKEIKKYLQDYSIVKKNESDAKQAQRFGKAPGCVVREQ